MCSPGGVESVQVWCLHIELHMLGGYLPRHTALHLALDSVTAAHAGAMMHQISGMGRCMIEVRRKETYRPMLQAASADVEQEKEEERQERLRRAINYFASWQRAADPARAPTATSSSSATSGPSHTSTCRSRGPVRRTRGPVRRARHPRRANAITGEAI